ncbi:MAG TPA: cytochrome c [Acetobacteraceae bacterium]|jgi:mono/diheme cytochrome c family protein|nr:cytochrome c [Acetobacteraceae bacterium]
MTIFRAVSIVAVVIVAGIVGSAFYVFYDSSMHAEDKSAPSGPVTAALIARGEYLTRAADCAACHTLPNGKPFAGGLPFKLPFGTIYSTNITADRESGIGNWSDDDFVRALHRGIAPGGRYLYPAFPYTSFTAMSRDDALAIKAYLFSLPPQNVANKGNSLSFPFNQRWGMAFWDLMFLSDRRFAPDPAQSAKVNRGAYLATALGHCGECHTPRNLAFAVEHGREFAGEALQGWEAYNITSDKRFGVGAWSDAQLASFLSSAHAEDRGAAAGPMAEAVEHSLQYLTPADLSALVAYLRTTPPQTDRTEFAIAQAPVASANASAPGRQEPQYEPGFNIFEDGCANCHQYDGHGRQTVYASLIGSRSASDPDGANVTQVILNGAKYRIKGQNVFMPPFGQAYSDAELAAVANYVIAHFGGKTGHVTPQDIAKQRQQ